MIHQPLFFIKKDHLTMTKQHKKTLYHYPFAYYFAIEKGTFPLSGAPPAASCDGSLKPWS